MFGQLGVQPTDRWARSARGGSDVRLGMRGRRLAFVCRIASAGIAVGLAVIVTARSVGADDAESAVGPLMKLLESGRVPAERQATVVEMICGRGNANDLRIIFDRAVRPDGFDRALRLRALHWLSDAATTRKVRPAGARDGLRGLIGESPANPPALREAAMRLAASWRDPSVVPELRAAALDPNAADSMRRVALDGLVAIGGEPSKDALVALSAPGNAVDLRMRAISGLSAIDLALAARSAVELLSVVDPRTDTTPLVRAFLDRRGGPESLGAALEDASISADVAKRALRGMFSVGRNDTVLADPLGKLAGIELGAPPPTASDIGSIVGEVDARGDAARGEAIFQRKDLSCAKCHSIRGAGGQVGPDLSAVGGASPTEYVVTSILNPNAAIKEQYATKILTTTDGRVLTGIVRDRDEIKIRINDAESREVDVPISDIEEESDGPSLMPQGLTRFLTRDELVDLARFVSELGKPGPFAVREDATIQRWKVLRSPAPELLRDDFHLDQFREQVLARPVAEDASVYARVSGDLPLEAIRSETIDPVVFLRGECEVVESGRVRFLVRTTGPSRVWIDDQPFEQQREFESELSVGRHVVTVRVELSDPRSTTVRVECVRPETGGAAFAVVGGP